MSVNAMNMQQQHDALVRMAMATLQPYWLATIGEVEVFQMPDGWQSAVLQAESFTTRVDDFAQLEAALDDTDCEVIIVAAQRQFSQSIIEQRLSAVQRPLRVYWEIAANAVN